MPATRTNRKSIAQSIEKAMGAQGVVLDYDQALVCVDTVFQKIVDGFQHEEDIVIDSFGTFTAKTVKEHKVYNRHTRETTIAPAHKMVSFRAALCVDNLLNPTD